MDVVDFVVELPRDNRDKPTEDATIESVAVS